MDCNTLSASCLFSDGNEDDKPFKRIEGIWWVTDWGLSSLRYALSYEAQVDDLFIVTYPRSGTTWMQSIVYNLRTGGKPFDADSKHFFEQSPHLETGGKKGLSRMQQSGAIKTHLPMDRISYNAKAKYICVIRNPNDVCVSYYLLYSMWPDVPKLEFDQFFEYFIQGCLPFNGYFEALRSVWQRRHYDNVLLVSYEEMRTDFRSVIHRIADFLNVVLEDQLLERVMNYSSFEYMKANFDKERRQFEAKFIESIKNKSVAARRNEIFKAESELKTIRKGEINNWKEFMTPEQSHRMYLRFLVACEGCDGLENYWSKWNVFGLKYTNHNQ